MTRKYTRRYIICMSNESLRREKLNKPKKSSVEWMRELRQRRKYKEKRHKAITTRDHRAYSDQRQSKRLRIICRRHWKAIKKTVILKWSMATRSVIREYTPISKLHHGVDRCLKFLLSLIFVHSGTWVKYTQMLTLSSLARYLISIHNIIPALEDSVPVPYIILGDFKVDTHYDKRDSMPPKDRVGGGDSAEWLHVRTIRYDARVH